MNARAIELNHQTKELRVGETAAGRLQLTTSEFAIAEMLVSNQGQVVGHDLLLSALYADGKAAASNSLQVLVSRIRLKLRSAGIDQNLAPAYTIDSVRGVGYVLRARGAA